MFLCARECELNLESSMLNLEAWKQTKVFICLCQTDFCHTAVFAFETLQLLMTDADLGVK